MVAGNGEEPLDVHLCPEGPGKQRVESTGAYLHEPALHERSLALLFLLFHHPTSALAPLSTVTELRNYMF